MKNKIAIGTWSWGVGGAAGGNVVFGNNLGVNELKSVFDAAIDNDLKLFDTAYAYANGQSEKILGLLAKNYIRKDLTISDKFTPGMQNDNAENPIMDMLNGSLERLGTDYIDMYWIHNAADIERWTPYLVDVVKSGKVKRIGVSNHDLEQVKRVQEILAPHGIKLDAVQNHFSLLYPASIDSGLLEYSKNNDIEFFSYMVLEQGALSGKYNIDNPMPADSTRGKTYNPIFSKMDNLLDLMNQIADVHQVNPAQIAVAWAIKKGTTPILGVTKLPQVSDAKLALNIQLSDFEMKQLETAALEANVNTKGGWEGKA
ncbi:aldo/keto reductase [Weissella koreensis]|uniref:aldo/keto reductase n=1 Tax=Weissella koreensis TaxID=165096 RepID=UPI00026F249C|nr:aldo/keto reductase [Weissella koreensis]AVH74665.1 aldo/keto reductase [Weissella koreensis]EJF34019.1 oxidoreductase, aldo/keto reductase family protein [Weissella koreensis KCTC 3621]EJF34309.1 oxidoreductase, aldo/keto reductase family protein [Weissella koreensis KCTC 3621]QGN19888.1 aldo/keto reductase [Weissella koreensis]